MRRSGRDAGGGDDGGVDDDAGWTGSLDLAISRQRISSARSDDIRRFGIGGFVVVVAEGFTLSGFLVAGFRFSSALLRSGS